MAKGYNVLFYLYILQIILYLKVLSMQLIINSSPLLFYNPLPFCVSFPFNENTPLVLYPSKTSKNINWKMKASNGDSAQWEDEQNTKLMNFLNYYRNRSWVKYLNGYVKFPRKGTPIILLNFKIN